MAPATSAPRIIGNVTYRNVCHGDAPRSADASSRLVPSRRSRAWVLLKTMTMQNVAWPTITVARPSVTPSAEVNVAFSAMPVTMPGNVIGSTTRKLTTLRPKNS